MANQTGQEESGYIGAHLWDRGPSFPNLEARNLFSFLGQSPHEMHFQIPDRNQFSTVKQDIYSLGVMVLDLIMSVYIAPDTAMKTNYQFS
jgi:hypothetical protein